MHWVSKLFFLIVVRPLTLIVLGMHVRHLERLPRSGPAILVANHNSHLDTVVLMSLFPLAQLPNILPIAAADYFLKSRFLTWFGFNVMNIVPISREVQKGLEKDPFGPVSAALRSGKTVIFFPEGSRGEPERLSKFKNGISRLAERHPDVPIIPIFMHGLGKALPKGEIILVPFFCDIFIGEALFYGEGRAKFMEAFKERMGRLAAKGNFAEWE